MISFGSYAKYADLRTAIPLIVEQLVGQYTVIIHNTWGNDVDDFNDLVATNKCYLHTGWLPYESIVQSLDMVVFTGSLCLQLTCLKYGTSMLFVPALTEQFFWAKSYEYYTKVPYIDIFDSSDDIMTQISHSLFALNSPEVRKFLKKVQNSMKKRACTAKSTVSDYITTVSNSHHKSHM